jgi:hypothetical protein
LGDIQHQFYKEIEQDPEPFDREFFLAAFHKSVQENASFLPTLIEMARTLSDIDLMLMTPEADIQTLEAPFLKVANEASVLLLRNLISDPEWEPFFGEFEPYTGPVPFFCRTDIRPEVLERMKAMVPVVSLPQTSNKIEAIHILLNRIKMKPRGGNQQGECLDFCMASLENPNYFDKLFLYLMGDYYTIEMVLGDLHKIVGKGMDDKYKKRVARLRFLEMIQGLPGINILFRILGKVISNETF